jgi:hypothetical protein
MAPTILERGLPKVKYKYSNLGFNYSHLDKQDKESLTEVVT